MLIITTEQFLAKVEEIAAEDPAYRIGGTGTDGTCDCIGLIVGAFRRAGGKWTGAKGSNYAARNEMVSLKPVIGISDLVVGEVVYKAREPGEAGYDEATIQKKYAGSADKRDYYHIGVVESVCPLRIRHMTTPRMKMDTSLGKWGYHGWLKKIRRNMNTGNDSGNSGSENGDHDGSEGMNERVVIYGGNVGLPVNMRSSGSLESPILCTIPQRTVVELVEYGERWCKVVYNGKKGAVQSAFVHREEDHSDEDEMIQVRKKQMEAVYEKFGEWLGLRG